MYVSDISAYSSCEHGLLSMHLYFCICRWDRVCVCVDVYYLFCGHSMLMVKAWVEVRVRQVLQVG